MYGSYFIYLLYPLNLPSRRHPHIAYFPVFVCPFLSVNDSFFAGNLTPNLIFCCLKCEFFLSSIQIHSLKCTQNTQLNYEIENGAKKGGW